MNELLEMFELYLNMDSEERDVIALEASNEIVSHLKQIFESDSLFEAYLQLYSIFSYADIKIQYEEYELFGKITGAEVSYEDFCSAVLNEIENVDVNEFFDFVDEQNEDFQGNLCLFAVCIFTCDGVFDELEFKFIDTYFLSH